MRKYSEADNIELVYSGTNYFELLQQMIDNSKKTFHLQTYIFDTDETGVRITEALKRAAQRKVSVYVMIDSFGSDSFSKKTSHDLLMAGVHFRKFSKTFSTENIHYGRRLHYKIAVADEFIGIIGGINIANKYNNTSEGNPWLDYAVQIKGNVCEYLHLLCEKNFKKQNNKALNIWENNTPHSGSGPHLIRFRHNDFLKGKNEIHQSYTEEMLHAQKSITIVASYFLPGKSLRKLLANASKRGVTVKIILADHSDAVSVKLAENYLYDFFLRNNIQLFEWKNSVLHGKAMLVDNKWATVGSYNLNFLSHYISLELNVDVMDLQFINAFNEHLQHIIATACKPISLNKRDYQKNKFKQIISWLAYSFFRILMIISVHKKSHKVRYKK
ncbi:MAG: hypothetical protein HYX39_02935 [Bacteroidetes bacterium]|nr:hypothetical protein [Bacteroidota bacterium]